MEVFDTLLTLAVAAQDEAERICSATACMNCEGHEYASCETALVVKSLMREGVTLADRKTLSEFLRPIDEYEGLKAKYLVFKADSGERVVDCFVLRPANDPAAVEALRAYANSTDNKTLANDITNWVGTGENTQREARLYWKRATANTWHLTCSACGTHLGCSDDAKFCHECGAKFVKPQAVAPELPEEDENA